jgi:Ca2+-binding EF-hand superfamily protein
METMDSNQDGIITWEEFVTAAIKKVSLLNERNMRAAFNVLDENGDKKITPDELKRRFKGA